MGRSLARTVIFVEFVPKTESDRKPVTDGRVARAQRIGWPFLFVTKAKYKFSDDFIDRVKDGDEQTIEQLESVARSLGLESGHSYHVKPCYGTPGKVKIPGKLIKLKRKGGMPTVYVLSL